jgi:hypothetical protein
VIENAPLEKGTGSASHHTSEARISQHHQPRRQAKPATEEIYNHRGKIKTKRIYSMLTRVVPGRSSMPRLNRIAVQRIRDIERYLAGRYGFVLPGDYAAAEDLAILLNHIAQNPVDPQAKMRGSIRSWVPWMDYDERCQLVERIAKKPRRYRAKTLGQLMRVTEEEHARWGLKSIRAFTVTDADMKAKELHRERARKAAKRRAGGAVTREEYLAVFKCRTKPWEAAGVSRAQWYRRKAGTGTADETGSVRPIRED